MQDRLNRVLLLVGRLNYTWTNTESLLIYLIAGLARVDKETAIVIFLTLNTTRARIDLVERMAKLHGCPKNVRNDVLSVLGRMSSQAKLRNKYSHCIYSFDDKGDLSHTQLMRVVESRDEVRYGKMEALDDGELSNIQATIDNVVEVNREIWRIVRENDFPGG